MCSDFRERGRAAFWFLLKFWIVFWGVAMAALLANSWLTYSQRLTSGSVSSGMPFDFVSGFFAFWLTAVVCAAVPTIVAAAIARWRISHSGQLPYSEALIISEMVSVPWIFLCAGPAAFSGGMPLFGLFATIGFAAAIAFIGRFAMTLVGILPSRGRDDPNRDTSLR
jgi:hypothetical protein